MRRTHATTEKANRPIWASRVAIERVSRSMGFELEGSFLNALEGVVRTVWSIYQCIGLACVPPGRCTLCLGVRQVESRMELSSRRPRASEQGSECDAVTFGAIILSDKSLTLSL